MGGGNKEEEWGIRCRKKGKEVRRKRRENVSVVSKLATKRGKDTENMFILETASLVITEKRSC